MKCRRCGSTKDSTTHHLLPRRIFGENPKTATLCRKCHDAIEIEIRALEATVLRNYANVYLAHFEDFVKMRYSARRKQ